MTHELKNRKTKFFQVEVSMSHADPSMPVRRVASVFTMNYESWTGVSSLIAGVIWAVGQRDRSFAKTCDPQIEKIVIYPLFVMPLPKGSFDYQPSRDREMFRWEARSSGDTVEQMLDGLTQAENRKSGTGMMFLPIAS